MIPCTTRLPFLEVEWGSALTFSNIPFDDFLFLFTCISLEKNVIFFSQNITLLTTSIQTFASSLRPFLYPHPIIFSLPVQLYDMIDSPVPCIIGPQQSGEINNKQEMVDLSEIQKYIKYKKQF
ncbi:hypothetical protein IMG5_149570 [Ichthyophthirius multifiliis]|uniref:UDENN domain-containing protein n=1 Tax=Ichthyophthirius multifiliis TaxID=5932 RepID=G0QYG9_ICHMU|nr:hypothetical protein IMG5_149570 [Ichthyophthirius multifiliis]EGR29733.1 hypothetical protein IMG5_149570 [Ichthyophthirius multifiliis]|eukprot:XP_004030969.1 hypothetical protein IMG5_149570 [Ichthyophthirius multifiliis]